MSLEKLPTEVLHAICQAVAQDGSNHLVSLTRASRQMHAISNPVLYAADLQETGGVISMCFGLASKRMNVVKLCLSAGCKPDLRIETCHDLESIFPDDPKKDDPLGIDPLLNRHVEVARYCHIPFPPSGHRNGPYSDSERDGNKPFRSGNAFFWTPLHVAALQNDVELLTLLLEHGANPNAAGRGVCPCYYQRLRRTVDRVDPPESENIIPMLQRRLATRWSPLHVAVCQKNIALAEYLISRFGLPHATESDDDVMAEARQFFRAEPVLATLVRSDPDVMSSVTPMFDPLPPLHVVVDRFDDLEYLQKLHAILKRAGCLDGPHSDVDGLDAFGDTPFSVAAFAGRTETFGPWLRDRGADINFALSYGRGVRRSILNALCKSGQHKHALLLMDMGVDIHGDAKLIRDEEDFVSTVHLCCGFRVLMGPWPVEDKPRTQRDAIALLKRLVHAGADINASVLGWTPLMVAVSTEFPAAVRVLLEGEADVRAENNFGDSALHIAVASGLSAFPASSLRSSLTIIQLLLDNGADPNQHLTGTADPPLFQGYWETGATPGVRPKKFSCDPTFERVPNPMASIAPLLIRRGADPNIYLDHPRDVGIGLRDQVAAIQGHSLAVTAFFNGEFDSLDSLVACGTLITYHDYLSMMRSLSDLDIRSKGSTSSSVQALFRILNGPSLRLERPEDRKSIMDAWTELLIVSVGIRPNLVHALAPHFSITDKLGYGGRTALHVLAQWERKSSEDKTAFQTRIRRMMATLMRCGGRRQIDQPDDNGRSPLHIAVGRGNVAVAKALVRAGASLHVEPRRQDGTIVDSPLREAIKGYSEASYFEMADVMLDTYFSKWDRKQDRWPESVGLLKDLILHFRDQPFDKPFRVAARTNKLMVKLFDLGVDVNEPDEDGNTILHLLVQLLYPAVKDATRTKTSKKSKRRTRAESELLAGTQDPESNFWMLNESYVHMRGVNQCYFSDSDFSEGRSGEQDSDDDGGPGEHGPPFLNDTRSDEDCTGSDDDDDDQSEEDHHNDADDSSLAGDFLEPNSMRVMKRKGYNGEQPKHKPGGLAKRGRARRLDRADAWILSFYIILSESQNDSLHMKNNAGKTPLDLIRGLKDCRVRDCPKAYRRIINALPKFDAEDPLSSELLNKLNGSSVIPKKGRPFFFVHSRKGCYLVVPGREGMRRVERRSRWRDQWTWVPFW